MIDISVFVWGTVRLAVRITERSFRSVNSFPAPVAVDALPAAGKPSPSYLHLLVASLLLPPLLFQPPPLTLLPLPQSPLSSPLSLLSLHPLQALYLFFCLYIHQLILSNQFYFLTYTFVNLFSRIYCWLFSYLISF